MPRTHHVHQVTRWGWAVGVVVTLAATATASGCGGSPTSPVTGSTTGRAAAPPVATSTATSTAPSTSTTAPAPAPVAAPGWELEGVADDMVVSEMRTFSEPGGSVVTVVRFRAGTFHLALHTGSQDPGSASVLPPGAQPSLSAAERTILVGAFNGGFKTSAGAGGVEIDGHVIEPLVPGKATLALDAQGHPTIGVWGVTLPRGGDPPTSLRQNLALLVDGGVPSSTVRDILSAWGTTVGDRLVVARSAVGIDSAGNLYVAGTMAGLPAGMAAALISAGALEGMEMDINPTWVQLDVASVPGGSLRAALPGQWRPATQYLSGWTRDYFAVLAG